MSNRNHGSIHINVEVFRNILFLFKIKVTGVQSQNNNVLLSQYFWRSLYMAQGNQERVVYGDRWDGLREAEGGFNL